MTHPAEKNREMNANSPIDWTSLSVDFREQLTTAILLGNLPGGTILPSLRQLEEQSRQAHGTVQRAVEGLVGADLLERTGRLQPSVRHDAALPAVTIEDLRTTVATLYETGTPFEDVVALTRHIWRQHQAAELAAIRTGPPLIPPSASVPATGPSHASLIETDASSLSPTPVDEDEDDKFWAFPAEDDGQPTRSVD